MVEEVVIQNATATQVVFGLPSDRVRHQPHDQPVQHEHKEERVLSQHTCTRTGYITPATSLAIISNTPTRRLPATPPPYGLGRLFIPGGSGGRPATPIFQCGRICYGRSPDVPWTAPRGHDIEAKRFIPRPGTVLPSGWRRSMFLAAAGRPRWPLT